ncbi:hypothetical protein TNCV_4632321 [Trichonephila clavipes]|nr:hypothetical protein TNCV_4632321 [Trichonephila clavipes]
MRTTLPYPKPLPVSAPITVHTPINDECPLVFQVPSPLTVKRLSDEVPSGREKTEEGGKRKVNKMKKSPQTWRSERTWQNERDSDYVGEDSNEMVLTT